MGKWVCILGAIVLFLVLGSTKATAWVQGYQPFPEGEATVVMQPYCQAGACSYYLSVADWEPAIRNALMQWNNAGADFVLHQDMGPGPQDICQPRNGDILIIIADPDQLCSGDGPMRYDARTEYGSGWARIYLSTHAESIQGGDPSRMLLHELGHAVGLTHPDEAGQDVSAVMNRVVYYDQLQSDDIEGIRALYGTTSAASHIRLEGTTSDETIVLRWTDNYEGDNRPAYEIDISYDERVTWETDIPNAGQPFVYSGLRNGRVYHFRIVARLDGKRGSISNEIRVVVGQSVEAFVHESDKGILENPSPRALKSGVGLISGWACDAEELEVSLDDGPRVFVPYGTERLDTAGVCGDTDNGFGLLINYNNLGDGSHMVKLYMDGALLGQSQFTVKTLGTDFLRDVQGQGVVALSDGKRVTVQWEEATQGFTIVDYK